MRIMSHPGFSLIEVMIATFVLAVGILGVAQLHLSSFQNNRDALYRNQATVIADDLLGRIRANPNALASGAYNTLNFLPNSSTPAAVSCASGCTALEVAARDVYEWARNFVVDMPGYQPSLPGAQGSGNIDSADTRGACPSMVKYDVVVQWLRPSGVSDQVTLMACL